MMAHTSRVIQRRFAAPRFQGEGESVLNEEVANQFDGVTIEDEQK
jgi:hypothetical protein